MGGGLLLRTTALAWRSSLTIAKYTFVRYPRANPCAARCKQRLILTYELELWGHERIKDMDIYRALIRANRVCGGRDRDREFVFHTRRRAKIFFFLGLLSLVEQGGGDAFSDENDSLE